jgi:DNA-binding NarL/FixJ family response regulator
MSEFNSLSDSPKEPVSFSERKGSVSVVLADSQALVRLGLRLLLENAGWKVVAEAADGHQAVAYTQQLAPDVLLSEVDLPRLHSFDVLRRLADGNVPVIMVSAVEDEHIISECLRLGAQGFVLKTSSFAELAFAIDAVLKNEIYLCTEATRIMMKAAMENLAQNGTKMALSQRELIVMQLAAQGKTSSEISTALFISRRTAEAHRANGMKKIGIHTQTELVKYGLKKKWLTP